ncbi:MAG: RluA family pseudouridine synthase [Myxococcota bacterium]|nr:RluA family pseudouridine synthase [Myxococcota bacterium]
MIADAPSTLGSDRERDVRQSFRFIAEPDDAGVRFDCFLRDQDLNLTRSRLKKLIDGGFATVDGQAVRPAQKLRPGQTIALHIPPPEPLSVLPQEMPLDIRYEDDAVIVVNKPQGLVVHPAPGHADGTLVNGILFDRTARGGDPLRPGIVHRLDKDTSGLMVVAKCEVAHAALTQQFHDRSVDRRYMALVVGSPPNAGEWQTFYGRRPRDRRLFSSKVRQGKLAISRFITVERFKGAALLEVTLKTGRTHQVRVHCYDHNFPVLGDPQYSPRRLSPDLGMLHKRLPGQALHAAVLGFDHPESKERLQFKSSPPDIFLEILAELRRSV